MSKIIEDMLTLRKKGITFFAVSLHRSKKQRQPGSDLREFSDIFENNPQEKPETPTQAQDYILKKIHEQDILEDVVACIEDYVSIISMTPPEWFLANADGVVDNKYLQSQTTRKVVPQDVLMFTKKAVKRFHEIQKMLEAGNYGELAADSVIDEATYRKIGEAMTPSKDATDFGKMSNLVEANKNALRRNLKLDAIEKRKSETLKALKRSRDLLSKVEKKIRARKEKGTTNNLKTLTKAKNEAKKQVNTNESRLQLFKNRIKTGEAVLKKVDNSKAIPLSPDEMLCPETDVGVGVRIPTYYMLKKGTDHAMRSNFVNSYRCFTIKLCTSITSTLKTCAQKDGQICAALDDEASSPSVDGGADDNSIMALDSEKSKTLRQIMISKLKHDNNLPGFSADISIDDLPKDARKHWPLLVYMPMQSLNMTLSNHKKDQQRQVETSKGRRKGEKRRRSSLDNSASDSSSSAGEQDKDSSKSDSSCDSGEILEMLKGCDVPDNSSEESEEERPEKSISTAISRAKAKKTKGAKKEVDKEKEEEEEQQEGESEEEDEGDWENEKEEEEEEEKKRTLNKKKKTKEEKKQEKIAAKKEDKKRQRRAEKRQQENEHKEEKEEEQPKKDSVKSKKRKASDAIEETSEDKPARKRGRHASQKKKSTSGEDSGKGTQRKGTKRKREQADDGGENDDDDDIHTPSKKAKEELTLEDISIKLGNERGMCLQKDIVDMMPEEDARELRAIIGEVGNWDVVNLHSESKTCEDTFEDADNFERALEGIKKKKTLDKTITFSPVSVVRACELASKKNLVPQLPVEQLRKEKRSTEQVYETDFIEYMKQEASLKRYADAIHTWNIANDVFGNFVANF